MNAALRTDDVMRYQDARFKTIAAKLCPPSIWWWMTPPR